ncbi:MAG: hypothetical protein ACKVQR_09360 [Aquabacterium sp.]
MRHVGTQVTQAGAGQAHSIGQTVWVGSGDAGEAGMAWDWVLLRCGIVAMADPMGVITNLRLMGTEGEFLPPDEAARHLNEIVHALPWQDEVERALVSGGPPVSH